MIELHLLSLFLASSFNLSWPLVVSFIIIIYIYLLRMFPIHYDYSLIYSFVDMVSFSLVILSVYISVLIVVSIYSHMIKAYSILLLCIINLLLFFLVASFFSLNALLFYFFFECSLIPTFFLILGWGYQPERIQASVYFMFYTLFASLPLLLVIVHLSSQVRGLRFFSIFCFSIEKNLSSCLVSLFIYMAFFIKLPVFLLHLWLPKAHVEAPVAGSMILAGVLLKLGGYGIIRIITFSPSSVKVISSFFWSLSMSGMVFIGLACCRINDLKALIAYSSVSHMGLVLSGVVTSYIWGFYGGLLIMLSHGLSSSGLFCIVNIYYERSLSRRIYLNRGLLLFFPSLSLIMFLLCASNISAPPTLNLFSEIFLIYSLVEYSVYIIILFPLGSFLGAVFTFFLFSHTQHGKSFSITSSSISILSREYHLIWLHIFPINTLILICYYLFI